MYSLWMHQGHLCSWAVCSGDDCSGSCQKHAGIQVNDEVHRVRDYCQNFAPRRTDASEQIVRKMVAEQVTHPYYWALIMNLSPETMDEFVHLLPELDVRIHPALAVAPASDSLDIAVFGLPCSGSK